MFLNTVFDEIAYAPRNVGVDEARVAMLVHASAARVGLAEELLDRHPMELSGGQARRVGLAATLARMRLPTFSTSRAPGWIPLGAPLRIDSCVNLPPPARPLW